MAIPEGWRVRPLSEDVELVSGQHLLAEDWHEEPRGVPYLTGPADFPNGRVIISKYTERPKVMCREGDIVVTVKGSGCGRIARVFVNACISRQLMALRTQSWNSEFIFHVLSSSSLTLAEQASGLIPGLSREQLLKFTVQVPPLPEQKKIAAVLSSVDETIAKTESVIAQLQIVKKAMMEQLLTKGMPGRHTRFKQTEIGEIPEEWTLRTVGELARLSGGHGFRPPDWRTQGLPIIRIQNLNGSDSFNYYDGEVEPDWLVEPGELLFAWAGSRGASFGPKIWSGPRGLLNQHIYRVTPRQEVTTEFLFLQLLCLTAEVEKKAHGFKDTLLHLQKHELTGFQVGLPTLDEQNEISRSLGSVQSRIVNEERFLKSVLQARDALRSSLLSGEIRVIPEVA